MESPPLEHPLPALPDPPAHIEALEVLGARVDVVSMPQTLAMIGGWVAQARQQYARKAFGPTHQVVTLNPEIVMAARADPTLRDLINRADLVVPDGGGIVWALRRRGFRVAQRVTGVDTVVAVAELAARQDWRLFLLGAAPGVAEEAARRMCTLFPGLIIAGTYSGSSDPRLDERTAGLVRASAPDILCVAFGAPSQERWIARNRDRLGASVAIGVGGTLDFLSGRVPRAPLWMRRVGIEWLYRLWREPWRWRRMVALPRFVLAVLRDDPGKPDGEG